MPKPFAVFPKDRSRALDVVGEKITVLASKNDTHGYELFFHDGTKGNGRLRIPMVGMSPSSY